MKALKIFMAFILMMLIGFFAIGFSDTVATPTAGTAAYNQSANLSKVVDLADTGIYSTMLILIVAMVLAAMIFMASMIKRRK